MTLAALNKDELEVVRRTMEATFRYLDFDFHPRLGISEAEMHDLLERWPDVDDADDDAIACGAINNALNDLLHGVGISDNEAMTLIGVDTTEMRRIYEKWASARNWTSTGLR